MRRVRDFVGTEIGRRLRLVFSAQFLNQLTTIVMQLGLVPILLYAWGMQTYGIWLLLSAVPAYLTLSDFGFTTIAKNEMLISVSSGNRAGALRTFQSIFKFLNLALAGLLVLTIVVLWSVDLTRALNLGDYSKGRAVMLLLVLNVLAYQYFLLICSGVRCENRVATEASWGALARFSEGAVVAMVALSGGGLVLAAGAMLASRVVFCVLLYLWLRRASPWLPLGQARADWGEIRRLFKPAMAFMLMPISQSLLIQAPLVVIGFLLGPTAVVTFATTRTLARAGTAVTNMLNGALQGEYSVAFGRKDAEMLRSVLRYHQLASSGLILCYALAIYALHRPLMALYTHGQVNPTALFFGLMTLAIAAEMMWSSISTPLLSINRHVTFSYLSLAICTIGMAPLYLLTASMDLVGAATAMLAIQVALLLLCWMLRHNIAVGKPADSIPEEGTSLPFDLRGPTRKGCT